MTTALPGFTTSAITYQQSTVAAGQTALYSFSLAQTVFTGTITFSASGLPADSSVSFSPATITAGGCSVSNTVALSVLTQQGAVQQGSIGVGGRGLLGCLASALGLAMAALIGLRRRASPLRFGRLWMVLFLAIATSGLVACGNVTSSPRTPAGTYNITITATGSTGTTSNFTVPLTVK